MLLAAVTAGVRGDVDDIGLLVDDLDEQDARNAAAVLAELIGIAVREIAVALGVGPDDVVEHLRVMLMDAAAKPGR